jgi:hypothetical protein
MTPNRPRIVIIVPFVNGRPLGFMNASELGMIFCKMIGWWFRVLLRVGLMIGPTCEAIIKQPQRKNYSNMLDANSFAAEHLG